MLSAQGVFDLRTTSPGCVWNERTTLWLSLSCESTEETDLLFLVFVVVDVAIFCFVLLLVYFFVSVSG